MTPDELIAEQQRLAAESPLLWSPGGESGSIAACFVCWPRGASDATPAGAAGSPGDPGWAAATWFRGGEPVLDAIVFGRAPAAYEPGLLALREGPLLEAAVQALQGAPTVLLVNATGRDHPRRAGLALHLGERLGIPTIGVTNRPLLAAGDDPAAARGATSPLELGGEVVAVWVRTRSGAQPLAVHAAWRTDVATAVGVVLACTGRWRTPAPLRRARSLAREAREHMRASNPRGG